MMDESMQDEETFQDGDRFVTVARFFSPTNAQMAKAMLESAGVECFLQGENANSLLAPAFRARLQVHKADETAARELLDSVNDDAVELSEEPPQVLDE